MSSRRPGLTIAQQAAGIAGLWQAHPRPVVGRGVLRWTGSLQPTAVSPAYAASLTYQLGTPPHVYVLDPVLDPGHREQLPHVYEGNELCLYDFGDWKPTMPLGRTVIPWTAEWLLHYEIWRTTDRWVGGGRTHEPRSAPGASPEAEDA